MKPFNKKIINKFGFDSVFGKDFYGRSDELALAINLLKKK